MVMSENRRRALSRASAALASFLAVVSVQPAVAYVDPGTGSMLVQMMIAGIAGAMFYFRELRLQFMTWVRRVVLQRTEPAGTTAETGEKPFQRSDD
jgi:hypothetical protein